MPGNYTQQANQRTPALIIYLIDISGSMSEPFENGTKIDYVNQALESILGRMIQRSTKGETISPRYRLAMAAYSDTVIDMLGGIEPITEVAQRGNPKLAPTNATDSYAAFVWARDILSQELPNLKGCPAPMVCHLTDGQFTGTDPEPIAREIMQMSNDDGQVLVENIFLGPNLTINPITDVEGWPGVTDVSHLSNPYAKKLFNMSSPLPASYADVIAEEGYALGAGARLLMPGSSSGLIELAFAVSGATPIA